MRSDLGPVRIGDDHALIRYGYRVASTVGLMMCAGLGVRRRQARPHAVDLGSPFSSPTSPATWPRTRGAAGVTCGTPVAGGRADPEALVRREAAVARWWRRCWSWRTAITAAPTTGCADLPWRVRPAILVTSRVYRAIGVRLRRRGCDALAGRTVVPLPHKLYWAGRAAAGSLRPRVLGLVAPRGAHDPSLHVALRGFPGVDA